MISVGLAIMRNRTRFLRRRKRLHGQVLNQIGDEVKHSSETIVLGTTRALSNLEQVTDMMHASKVGAVVHYQSVASIVHTIISVTLAK